MNSWQRRFPVLVGAVVVLLLGLSPGLLRAEAAPDFSLRDQSGALVSMSDFEGTPLVLHFWATWCPYCKKLQPGLEQLSVAFKDRGMVLLGISFREDEGVDPQAVLRQRGHTFNTLVEGDAVAQRYGVRGTPTTVFIDRRGQIAGITHTSDPDDPELVSLSEQIVD